MKYEIKDNTITFSGTAEEIKTLLTIAYNEEMCECNHEFSETIEPDDRRYFGVGGELIEEMVPDYEFCPVCEKSYNPVSGDWE